MVQYHAVMLDETGQGEFGAEVNAADRGAAYNELRDRYPESRCVQLESAADTIAREQAMYDHISKGDDYDEEGRPIYRYSDWADRFNEEDDQ